VPGINLAHLIGIRRLIRAQGGAYVAHEGDGRAGRGPDSQHPSTSAVRVTEGVPLPAGGDKHRPGGRFPRLTIPSYQQAAAQHIDRLIERIVRVRIGPAKWAGTVICMAANPAGRSS
jgi:hypothetical protein